MERIDVLVHPQSVVHSLVQFRDGGQLAQLGTPDMRLPIAHCLLWPRCEAGDVPPPDLTRTPLTFERPDVAAFPCLDLARRALAGRGGRCVALNAANEAAVELFLHGNCGFTDIPRLIAAVLQAHEAEHPGHESFCAPEAVISAPGASTPAALTREAHTLAARLEELDRLSRERVRALARPGGCLC